MVNKILDKLKIEIYADGASIKEFKKFNQKKIIKGFTTNPSLMKKNKIINYKKFAVQVSKIVYPKPISFEIFTDDLMEMYNQALIISSWNKNIYVKIPIVNSKGKSTLKIVNRLLSENVKCNVTAIFDIKQLNPFNQILKTKTDLILSVFCGRIADSGINPILTAKKIINKVKKNKKIKILWASTREPFSIINANNNGCHIITVPTEMLPKLKMFGKNNIEYSIETVKTFLKDAKTSMYNIK
jgi:transaldolase